MKRFLLVLLICANAWAYAQEITRTPSGASLDDLGFADRYFEAVGDSESIPDNNVTALAEDASGLIWIGTPSGLFRYDGYRFRPSTGEPGSANVLGTATIRALALAKDGQMWIGTNVNGVSVYNPKSERFTQFRHLEHDASSLSHNEVRALAATPDGGMWVGTRAGINLRRAGQTSFERFPLRLGADTSDLDDRVSSLLLDTRGALWVGSFNGLSQLAVGSKSFVRVHARAGAAPQISLAGENISSLYELQDGRIGIGTTRQGSMLLDPGRGTLLPIPIRMQGTANSTDARALAMMQPNANANANELWLGSFGGLLIVDSTPGASAGAVLRQLRPDPSVLSSLAHTQVRTMIRDRSGHIWIGGYGGSLQRHDPTNSAIRVLHHSPMRPNGLSSQSISSILERSNGELWLGTRENGIDILERGSGTMRHLKPEAGNSDALGNGMVTSLAETADRAIWAGTGAGLFRFDPNTQIFRSYGEQYGIRDGIRRLLAGKNGELWIGTNNSLYRCETRTQVIEAIKLVDGADVNADINALILTSEGRLWVGSGPQCH